MRIAEGSGTVSGDDGLPAQSPGASIRQAAMLLQLAEERLTVDPAESGPEHFPGLLWSTYQALTAVASINSRLVGADLDPARRADLTEVGVSLAAALAALRVHAVPPGLIRKWVSYRACGSARRSASGAGLG
jgi:hypothetical protein